MKKKIVVLGGGTGASTVLAGLKGRGVELSGIVSMADDGGSTGILRKELGVLPPGDIRQCLLALSNASEEVKALFGYRFSEGSLKGHNAGNLILAALEKSSGSFESAIESAKEMLKVEGDVIPVTLDQTTLHVIHGENKEEIVGEHLIDEAVIEAPRSFLLEPQASLNPKAKEAIEGADLIIIGPGSLGTSLIPVLLVDGAKEAIAKSSAKILFNVNLVTTAGDGGLSGAHDFVEEIEKYLPRPIDIALYNTGDLPDGIEGAVDDTMADDTRFFGLPLVKNEIVQKKAGDMLKRSPVKHDSTALGDAIMDYLQSV